jgi:hypothetical protein
VANSNDPATTGLQSIVLNIFLVPRMGGDFETGTARPLRRRTKMASVPFDARRLHRLMSFRWIFLEVQMKSSVDLVLP